MSLDKTKDQETVVELEQLINEIGIKSTDELVRAFLALSDREEVSEELRSLATDAMLVAENDFNGEFKNPEELKGRLLDIKKLHLEKTYLMKKKNF